MPKFGVGSLRYYFKTLFQNKRNREPYIQTQVKNAMPSQGYLFLGALIIEGKIKIINTTNFDDLVKAGVYAVTET